MSSLWQSLPRSGGWPRGAIHGIVGSRDWAELQSGSIFGQALHGLRGQSILLALNEQWAAAMAFVELDGFARRIVLCTPDLNDEQLAAIAITAESDCLVIDAPRAESIALPRIEVDATRLVPLPFPRESHCRSEWILLTSGTSGVPKLVQHCLDSLAGGLPRDSAESSRTVWGTFYDIRRYGGLQIFLRALLGGTSMILSDSTESPRDFLERAGRAGITHLSGTPSHWRRALMSGAAASIAPSYVRLSGEIADQSILDALRVAYPAARIGHAFASTEAGVAFAVDDGSAGFPDSLLAQSRGAVELKIVDETLRIRSPRIASRYLGGGSAPIAEADGFVDTGDRIEHRNGRCHFAGRRHGVINVGGQKVFPEEVEAILNAEPPVRQSRVHARKSPITGAIVVAEVVLNDAAAPPSQHECLKRDLLEACRRRLPPHKVPAQLRFVPSIALSAAGKLARGDA